jgi:hypothetical protein
VVDDILVTEFLPRTVGASMPTDYVSVENLDTAWESNGSQTSFISCCAKALVSLVSICASPYPFFSRAAMMPPSETRCILKGLAPTPIAVFIIIGAVDGGRR